MISVEALELLLKVDSAVERHNGGMQGEASYLDAKERLHDFIATLEYHVASLESQLAATQARLAAFEEGYDPAVRMPADNVTVWIAIPIINGYSYDEAFWNDGRWQSATKLYTVWELERVARWFPLPGAKEDE